MPREFVKKYIDLLALHKLNTFHWHLTEDQGWRLEIKRYPKLTEVGAWRKETLAGKQSGRDRTQWQFDKTPHGGFYTQDDAREIVAIFRVDEGVHCVLRSVRIAGNQAIPTFDLLESTALQPGAPLDPAQVERARRVLLGRYAVFEKVCSVLVLLMFVSMVGAAALTLSGLAWAAGSMLSRRDGATTSAPLSAGMNLLSGGALLMLSSAALGEPVSAAAFTMHSMLAVGYLVVAGSTIAFAVYVWLIRVADPTRVSTFAFVNPLVALALGWAFAGEPLTPRVAGAAVLMLSGVAAIVMAGRVAAAAGDGVWKRGPRPLAVPSRGRPAGAVKAGEEV